MGYKFYYEFLFSCDAANGWALAIQDPSTPSSEGMIFFHNYLMFFLIVIGFVVVWLLLKAILNSQADITLAKFTHSSYLEIGWTILPAIILLFMAVPSFCLLYSLDELTKSTIVLKILGHQWFWSYEYVETNIDEDSVSFDSYIIDVVGNSTSRFGLFRILETDNRVVLPTKTHIKLLISSSDVLHSWAIPSFGIKVDACPGRLTEASLFIKRKGTFYGQCSEICGVNHGFMPIVVTSVDFAEYLDWLMLQKSVDAEKQSRICLNLENFQKFLWQITSRVNIKK